VFKLLITAIFIAGFNLEASQLYRMDFGYYEVITKDQNIYNILKGDPCARTVVRAMKSKVLDPIEMDEGVDLAETVELDFLMSLKGEDYPQALTYSITANDVSRLVLVKKTNRQCKVLKLYNAGDI
jgi:hypothetical protein